MTILIAIIHLIGYTLLPSGTPGMWNTAMAAGASGPKLLAMSPADNATGVSTDTKLQLTFDEPVQRGTSTAAVRIREVNRNIVVETYEATSNRISISSNIVTITPSPNVLQSHTDYYVTIDPGTFRNSSGVDFAGLTDATAWNFRTSSADSTPPALLNDPSKPIAVQVGEPIVLQFSEPVYASSGMIQIENTGDFTDIRSIPVTDSQVTGSGTASISILPTNPLRGGASYRITIPNTAFADAAGNRFPGTSSPLLVNVTGSSLHHQSFEPATHATGVAAGTNKLEITFNRNVVKGTGDKKITVKNRITNAVAFSIEVNSTSVEVNHNKVTIQLPSGGLAANTSYYVLIDPGAFVDKADGSVLYAGITDAVTWTFTTMPASDVTPPTIVELTPADNSVNPSLSQTLKIKFSEPVYPGSGSIVIRNSISDAVFDSIPVTSNRVTGFGTDTISIQVASPFASNQSYYVMIGNQAFRDAAGNNFAGIADKSTWNFSVSRDNTPPTIVSMQPAPNSMNVPTDRSQAVFRLTFSEAVRFADGSTESAGIRFRRSSTSSVSSKASIDSDGKTVVIVPDTNFQSGTKYYVEIPAGLIVDIAGNPFGGILNEHIWSFGTIGSDRTAPAIQSAAMSGSNRIVMTYNEPLDENSVPPTGSFYVTANDTRVNVTGVTVSGQSVILTLQSGIVYGQTVKLYYTRSSPAIQDLSGNQAANLSNYTVKNEAGSTQTAPLSGSVNGNVLTLTFNSSLQPVHEEAYRQFRVYAGGISIAPSRITSSGSTVTLTLSSSVTTDANVYVHYSAGSYPLRDVAGNTVASFSSFPVRNTLDKTAPVLQSIYASGTIVTLVYNEALDSGSVPRTNQFVVMESGISRTISSVSVSGTTVVLTLSTALTSGQNVTLSYTGGSPALRDLNGNNAPTFSNQLVTNGMIAVNLRSATVSGNVVLLTFDSSLRTTHLPAASQFTVKENGMVRTVNAVSVNGAVVRLDLAQPIAGGSTVTVSYRPLSTGMLQSTTGIPVPEFTDYVITQGSGNSGGGGGVDLGGNYETAADGGVNIKTQAASVSTKISVGGRSANRYLLSSSTVNDAYSLSRSRFNQYRVTFTVPATQAAAMVEVPADAILDVKGMSNRASFAVIYGDIVYELPLSAIDETGLAELIRKYGQGQLLIEIDKGTVSQASRLRTALTQQRMQMISDTYVFNLSFVSGNNSEPLTQLKDYPIRKISILSSLSAKDHTVVWLEPETGQIAPVPTIITAEGNASVVTFKHHAHAAYALIRNSASFTDIPSNHWARDTIQVMTNRLIATGRTNTKFEPNQPITRAEFAVFIVRGLGLEGSRSSAARFRDIPANSELASYIGAAYKANIIKGVSSNRFDPNSPITREQMAAMMVRAASAMGYEILLPRSQSTYLSPFKDGSSVSSWARIDMAKAIEAKIIGGLSSTQLGPQRNATRAEAVAMIRRLLQYLKLM